MTTIRLFTMNCFGVPTMQTRRRLVTLANELNEANYDVVCLQEIQSNSYRRIMVNACTNYGYNAYQPFVHAPKGGLLTLSKHCIEAGAFTLYKARGHWYTPAVADWILHKGILCTRMSVNGTPIVVMNTHLNANYRGNWHKHSHYTRFEQAQLKQLAEYINAQPRNALVVVAGDFNIPRHSWLYDEFVAQTGVIDPMQGDKRPTLRLPVGMPERYAHPIDFTFVRMPSSYEPLTNVRLQNQLCYEDKMPLIGGGRAYLSDHFGLELTVSWEKQSIELPLETAV